MRASRVSNPVAVSDRQSVAATMSSQQHQSDPGVLDRRTLKRDHRVLAELLRPGMAVLDVGCGTGAITRGIADAVGPTGTVVGVDRDRSLIDRARSSHSEISNLQFIEGDVTLLDFDARFDIATAARTLQWVADVPAALRGMARSVTPDGMLVILDYNHALHTWDPDPPPAFAEFYARFLAWREANGWDNEVANRCAALLDALGCREVTVVNQDQAIVRGAPGFEEGTALWMAVIDHLGATVAAAERCDASLIETARRDYDQWRRTDLQTHSLSMRTSLGRVPASTPRHLGY
jgi:ubiquinone/menaquinone biosynthesis C-methylase UbiE